MTILSFVLFIIFFCSCRRLYVETPSKQFLTLLNNNNIKDFESKLNFYGVYHFIDSAHYHTGTDYMKGKPTRYVDTPYMDNPILFFKNGFIAYENALIVDSSIFFFNVKEGINKKKTFINNWGGYQITNDTIKAIIYVELPEYSIFQAGTIRIQCRFQGILLNKDTILQWHMTEPYSDAFSGGNKLDYIFLSTPRDLYFKKAPIKELINPDNAWINDFKEDSVHKKRRK